ncbi:MAG TPA: serine/threonine-protein kinase [Pyrinomonadaceae bacterium]|nr:serine/threonine-protein kinase [Pyrinomonadaceae bacterium]
MGTDDWKEIKAVLLEALRLDPRERASYLGGAGLTPEARAEVESLLALEAEAEDFMSLPAGEFSKDLLGGQGPPRDALAGQRVGNYEIELELGCGGMGAVYLARRADGKFEQRVAVKMLKRELNTEKLRRAFDREKEILAALAHPHIAALLDAGTTDDGIPYLVMEYVRGLPIDEYCRSRALTLNARLKLFNKVCDAVAFAHRNLIVHRDLKPSNILVNPDGDPKLLDFGISKLLDPGAQESAGVTQAGALTPQYASPEQIRGEPVTTATDIYSLGVVLFKILTGNYPYDFADLTNGALLREIAGAEPAAPSETARTHVSPALLRGDLDNIVLKSLRKEPRGRYQTVEQFSADIWRFIDGRPVLARPATLAYRARKFYGRNKAAVLAAALILLSLFAGVAAAVSQARAAREQARIAAAARRRAELEAERAKREKEKAERTSRFMQSFLNYANPHWTRSGTGGGKDVTVREALNDAVARMETELADAPELRADLHYTIGEVHRTRGEYETALRHFRQSLDLYRQVHGEEHPKVARGIYYLCTVMDNALGSDIGEVEPLLRQAIRMMRRTDPENVNLPHMLQSLANWNMSAGRGGRDESRLAEAESLILEAKALFTRQHGEGHVFTLTADGSLAQLARARGDLAREESIREELVVRFRRAHEGGYNHIWAVFYLAEVKRALGKGAEAEALFAQAGELGRKHWGADDRRFDVLGRRIKRARAASVSQESLPHP